MNHAPPPSTPGHAATLRAAADRYKPLGISARLWARGKILSDPVYAAVLGLLPQRGTLADLGCGEGYLLAIAAQARPDLGLIGLDHDTRRLDLAKRALAPGRVTFITGDVMETDLPPCNAITALDLLHYLPDDEQDALLARLAGALAPGGLLIIRDAEPGRSWRSRATIAAEKLARITGRHKSKGLYFRPIPELIARLGALGLEVTCANCSAGTPFSNRLITARCPPIAPDPA